MGLKRRSSEPREEQGEAHRVQGEAKSPGKGSQGKTDTEETETTNKSLCLSLSVCLSQAHAHSLVHILSHPYPPLSAITPKFWSFAHTVPLPRMPSIHLVNFFHPSEGSSNVTSAEMTSPDPLLTLPGAPRPLANSESPHRSSSRSCPH